MSRMWLNDGLAVLTDGRAVLCDECPCGCRYTYYVDHSLVTSGDGLTWETAFKSVNDVFNSLEIRNYRVSGCLIYVKIKGSVTYSITGSYLWYYKYAIPYSPINSFVYLQPEDSEHRVSATVAPLISATSNLIIFDRWDIVTSNPPQFGIVPYKGVFKFLSCTITASYDVAIRYYSFYLLAYSGEETDVEIIDCEITMNISNPSNSAYWIGVTAIAPGGITKITGVTININVDSPIENTNVDSIQGVSHSHTDLITIENSSVNFSIETNYTADRAVPITAYLLAYTIGSVKSCSSSRHIDMPNVGTSFCRFSYTENDPDDMVFFDCEQDSFVTSGYSAFYPCPDLL